MTKIKIVCSNPKYLENDIDHLIGQEFEVIDVEEDGVKVQYGEDGGYLIHHDEYEIIAEI